MSDDRLWEDGNSYFRPSYSATWLNCSGALRAGMYAEDTAGEDAAIGTAFHWLMAEWQTRGRRPDDWLGRTFDIQGFDVTIDEEMFVYGEECLAYVEQSVPDGDVYVETKVDISSLTPIPDQSGTADLAVCAPGELDIIDWKYGLGVQVFAEKNTQTLLYGWGFFEKYDWLYDFQKIRLHIAQPRLNHFDVWEITREELIAFADYARVRAAEAWKRNAPRSPSPKACQWCKVRVDCPALEVLRQQIADESFGDIMEIEEPEMVNAVVFPAPAPKLPSPVKLSTIQLARIYKYRGLMEGWFKDIGEELTSRALEGEQVPGWKMAEGRSRRRWKDEQLAAQKLSSLATEDDMYQRKFVSPNQAEKLLHAAGVGLALAKRYIKTLVVKSPGKPTLVPDGDNRLALPNIVDDSFEDAL